MDRTIIITGASRGLGLALAQRFIQQGDRVFGVSRSRKYWKQALQSVVDPSQFHLSAFDLTSEPRVKAFLQNVKRKTGKIDGVINNAGYGGPLERTEKLSVKELRKNLDQNLLAPFLMCKHAVPILRQQKSGFIINISSMAGTRAVPQLFAYSAAKFGVLALSQCIAKENTDTGIRCFTVCPGGMNTKMREDLFGKEDAAKQQPPDFVADTIMQTVSGDIQVESGGHIIIRHGKITAICPCPGA